MDPGEVGRAATNEVGPHYVSGAERIGRMRRREGSAAHAGRMRRLETGQGVLYHDALLGREPQCRSRTDEALGIGLAGRDVLRRDDDREERSEIGNLEHELDLAPERAGHDREREAFRGGGANEVAGARDQGHRPPDGRPVVPGLALDRGRHGGGIGGPAMSGEGEAKALAVVEAEILAVVALPVEWDV